MSAAGDTRYNVPDPSSVGPEGNRARAQPPPGNTLTPGTVLTNPGTDI